MKPQLLALAVSLTTLPLHTAIAHAQATFDLSFEAPTVVEAPPGASVQFDVLSQSTQGGPPSSDGAQGWSLSISSVDCDLTGVTVQGTAAADVNDDCAEGIRNKRRM